jgi:hypothetical protein
MMVFRMIFNAATSNISAEQVRNIYGGAVALAAFYGAIRGTFKWIGWRVNRKPIEFNENYGGDIVGPIINSGYDGSIFMAYTGGSATFTGLTVALLPISVPLFMRFGRKCNSENNNNEHTGGDQSPPYDDYSVNEYSDE